MVIMKIILGFGIRRLEFLIGSLDWQSGIWTTECDLYLEIGISDWGLVLGNGDLSLGLGIMVFLLECFLYAYAEYF